MRVLGVDPGIALTGYGIVEDNNNMLTALSYGCITTSSKDSISDRLKIIYNNICNIITRYNPDILAIEEIFFSTNVKTAIIVGEVRGVVILGASNYNLSIVEYTPLEVKQTLTGYGHADKKQIQYMVKNLLNLPDIPKPDDVADGLAVAISHIYSYSCLLYTS